MSWPVDYHNAVNGFNESPIGSPLLGVAEFVYDNSVIAAFPVDINIGTPVNLPVSTDIMQVIFEALAHEKTNS